MRVPPGWALAASLGALLLGGCAAPGAPSPSGEAVPADAAVAALDARRAALDAFDVAGAFGYWTEEQNLTARLDWREADGRTELRLVAPLGLGRLTLSQDSGGATLARSGAPPATGPSAGALLQRELGLAAPIPLEAVRDWLRGLPGPDATDVRRDASGRLETLLWTDASGGRWFARVRRWTRAGELDMPALLTARSGERRLRLALSDWRLGGAGAELDASGARGADDPDAPPPGGGRLGIPGR